MRKILFLLVAAPCLASAGPLFDDEFMKGCIKGGMDFIFSQTGPVSATDRARIVKTCLCLQSEYNRTVTREEHGDLIRGRISESFNRKDAAAQMKCVLPVQDAPTSVPKPRTNYADPEASNSIGADTPRKAR
jgi:hypothetical protein